MKAQYAHCLFCKCAAALMCLSVIGCVRRSGGGLESYRSSRAVVVPLESNGVDLGSIDQGGVVQGIAVLRNGGTHAVEIEEVRVSCDCLTVELPKRVLTAAEEMNIGLRFDLKGEPGFVGALSVDVQGFDKLGREIMTLAVAVDVKPPGNQSGER